MLTLQNLRQAFLIFAIFFVNPKEAACACLRQ